MSDASVLQARLVGALFVARGLLTDEQLERALELQAESGTLLGEILVAEFGIARIELASVLAEQWAELENEVRDDADTEAEDEPPALSNGTAASRRRIGEIIVEQGFVSESEIEEALAEQKHSGKPIGEVLIERGSLSRLDLAGALAEQWAGLEKIRPPAPKRVEGWQQVAPAEHVVAAAQGAMRPTETPVEMESPPVGPGGSAFADAVTALSDRILSVETQAAAVEWADELRATVDALAARLDGVEAGLDGRLPAGAEEIAALRTALDELRERLSHPEARLSDVEGRVGVLEAHRHEAGDPSWREDLEKVAGALAARLDGFRTRLDEAVSGTQSGLDAMHETLAEVQERVDGFDAHAGPGAHEHPELAGIEVRLEDLRASGQAVGSLAERLAALEERGAESPWRDEVVALRGRLEEVVASGGSTEGLAERLGALERRGAESPWRDEVAALQARLDELAATGSAVDGLAGRLAALEERGAESPWRDEVVALRGRLDELAATGVVVDGFAGRLAAIEQWGADAPWRDEVAVVQSRLADLAEWRSAVEGVAERLAALEERAPDTSWSGELAELRAALKALEAGPEERLASVESRLQELAAAERRLEKRALEPAALDGLAERLAAAEARAEKTPWVEELAALGALLETRLAETPWSGELAELRAALKALEAGPEERLASVESRLQELAAAERRLEKRAVERAALDGLGERLAAIETRALETPWQQEIADLREVVASLAEESGGRADVTTVNELRDELGRLRRSMAASNGAAGTRYEALSARLDELTLHTDALAATKEAGASAIEAALQEARALGEERAAAAAAALAALDSKLRRRLDALAAEVARGEDVEAIATRVDASLGVLGGRVTAAEEAVAAARDAMGASVADVGAHLRSDVAVAAERLRLLEEAAARMAASHPVGAAELEAALDATEARLADRAAINEEVIAALRGRLEEIAAADGMLADRLHGVEIDLTARLEGVTAGHAQQAVVASEAAAAATLRVDAIEESLASIPNPTDVLRPQLADVQARIEAVEVAATAAAQAGAGWSDAAEAFDARVTVVEAALFSRDAVIEPRLAALERHLEEEASQADERARTVDRALRKGLASLGERLTDSEAAYVEAGNALRTSIERLGHAVADADVRIAARAEEMDRACFDADAYVAFVPTPEGYRLVAVEAALPAVGDVVELDGHGCLRVSRLGASPVPLDTRACAYLEAPDDVPGSGDA